MSRSEIVIRRGNVAEDKKKEVKKQDKPKRAPQKKSMKAEPVKKAVISPMVHIEDFLGLATEMYEMDKMQQAGFKAYMTGKHYMTDMEAFVPYLEKYLGK